MNYNAFLENRGKHFCHTVVKHGDGVVCTTGFGAIRLTTHVWTLARGHFERKLVEDIGGYGVMHEHCKIEPLVEFIWKVDQWTKLHLVVQYVTDARGHTFICVQRGSHGWYAIARTNKPDDAMLMKEFFSTRRAHDKEGFGFCASEGSPLRIFNYRPDLLDRQTILNMYGYWLRWAERTIGGNSLHYGEFGKDVKHGVGTDKFEFSSLMSSVRSSIFNRPPEKAAVKSVQPAKPAPPGAPTPSQSQPGMSFHEHMQWHRDEYERMATWQFEHLKKAGKFEEACELVKKIIIIVGDKPESLAANYVKLGELLLQMQDHEKASEGFRRALALEPTDRRNWYVAHHGLGVCLAEMGEYREAEAYFRQATEIQPKWHEACRDLAITLSTLGEHAEAAKLFVQATVLSPYDSESFERLEKLLEDHEVVYLQVPEIKAEVERCRQLVKRKGAA
jgi:tetratricopeptide (TPR) repeat protein